MTRAWRPIRLALGLVVLMTMVAAPAPGTVVADRFVDDETDVAQLDVAADRLLVVSVGDSVASGEGNPGPAGWASARCHRSPAAGAEQALRLLAQAKHLKGITFVNLACSGATIDHGLLGSYAGIEHPRGAAPVTAQVDVLRRLTQRLGRPADAVLVSVGANDVHFGDIVMHCIKVPRCPSSGFDPDHLGPGTTVDATVSAALARLPGRYDALADRLDAKVVARRHVFITQYFDPTRNRLGRPCARILGGVGREELRWAEDAVLTPLNQEVSAAAHRNGWHPIGGIAEDFATHGYCTDRQDRWVRTLDESLRDLAGPLHPNAAGHLAIAARIAPPVGRALGLQAVSTPRGRDDGGGSPSTLTWVLIGIAVVLAIVALLVLGILRRLTLLLQRGHARRSERLVPPRLHPLKPTSLSDLAVKAAGVVGAAVFSTGFVVLVGAAIVWVRFWAARYPADQAVSLVSRGELLVIGAQALALFGILSAVAVVVLWLLDGTGSGSRRIQVGLALLVLAEMLAAVYLGGFTWREDLYLVAGLALVSFLAFFLSEVGERLVRGLAGPRTRFWAFEVYDRFSPRRGANETWWRFGARRCWQTLPLLVLLAGAIVAIRAADAGTRAAVVVAALALAALLFVAPGAVAGRAGRSHDTALRPVRAALAGALLTYLTIFLIADDAWLAGAALAATLLAGFCLAIAGATEERFLPFAVAVVFAVGTFGAVVACLRVVDSPQAQPVAILLKDRSSVCGVWVGESSGRVWYARLKLSELASVRRPTPRDSGLTSVRRDDVTDMALGPLQPVSRAADQAAALRSALRVEHGVSGPDPGPRCGPLRPRAQHVAQTPERRLAKTVQPELIVDRRDGFWPVSVQTLLAMQDRRARVCRRVADHTCVRVITQADLAFNGGDGEWLDYPANPLHPDEERALFHDALGSVDPGLTAREYFLVSGGDRPHAPVTVQFWFFYTYNYLETSVDVLGHSVARHLGGLHEGDFETVSVMLSADTHQPRYVWMARHKDEGRMFLWGEDQLRQTGGHLVAYASKGSHATYESCARQARIQAPAGLIDDRPQCDPRQELHLAPESTHLIDLSRVAWACWRGQFGEHPGGRLVDHLPYEADDGPRGPLWQQTFGGVPSEPCRGVRDTDSREGAGEEVLSTKVSDRLRAGAGRLDPAVDGCGDWEHAPTSGTLLLACDRRRLRRYLASGLEDPGQGGLHIDVVTPDAVRPGAITVPAVRRDPAVARLDAWRVTATDPAVADVYASCQAHGGLLEARFPSVRIAADVPLRVDDQRPDGWRLRDEAGRVVGPIVLPHVIKRPGHGAGTRCG